MLVPQNGRPYSLTKHDQVSRLMLLICRAVIKTAPDDQVVLESLGREYDTYRNSSIASNLCFRAMYDIIGDRQKLEANVGGLVLEWMDCTLAEVPPEQYQQNPTFIKAVVDAVLSSLVALEQRKLVNTGRTLPSFRA